MSTHRTSSITDFVNSALRQHGDRHQRMAEHTTGETDPDGWDSSELVQWAAGRAGASIPDGSWRQYQHVHGQGTTLTVDQALATPGALVFSFPTGDPLGAQRPEGAGVAISLGNGRVLEVDQTHGVRVTTDVGRFTHAGVLAEFPDASEPGVEVQSAIDQTLWDMGLSTDEPDEIEMDPMDLSGDTHPAEPDEIEMPPVDVSGEGESSGEPAEPPEIEMPTVDMRPESEQLFSDLDADGLNDFLEHRIGTDFEKADTDGDGLSDYLEWMSERSDALQADTDGDRVGDGQEYLDRSNPMDTDSDDDGWSDGLEKDWMTDPADVVSHPVPQIAPPDEGVFVDLSGGDGSGSDLDTPKEFEPPAQPDPMFEPDPVPEPEPLPEPSEDLSMSEFDIQPATGDLDGI